MQQDRSLLENKKYQELEEGKSIVEKDIQIKKTADKVFKEKKKSL